MEGWSRIMGDGTDKLAGEASQDLRVEIAKASAARGFLPIVRTSSSMVASVRLGVASASALGGPCKTALLDEWLLDLFLIGFGVVGLEIPSFLALFAGGAWSGSVELAAEAFAGDALRLRLSISIVSTMSFASVALLFFGFPCKLLCVGLSTRQHLAGLQK